SVTSAVGKDTVLPCIFKPEDPKVKITQVAWYKKNENGGNIEVAILNAEHGTSIFGTYDGRVEKHGKSIDKDGSILLKKVILADEGQYLCRVTTFPAGNFEQPLTLILMIRPHMDIHPGPMLVEGQRNKVAASCTAEGLPRPTIQWKTELDGDIITKNMSSHNMLSVTSEFIVRPERSMNEKLLTCVVSHPALVKPKEASHTVKVQYPPEVKIYGYSKAWHVGMKEVVLKCEAKANPEPAKYSWSRMNSSLPEGVIPSNGTLKFKNALAIEDEGVYVCRVTNKIGTREGSVDVKISLHMTRNVDFVPLVLIAIGVLAVVLLFTLLLSVVLINRYHKKKTQELAIKLEEISTMSRQTSLKRINSVNTDVRLQTKEPLIVYMTLVCSQTSFPLFKSMLDKREDERYSLSTITTVREMEVQTDPVPTTVPEDDDLSSPQSIQEAMNHFQQQNGTLRAKPSANGIYVGQRGQFV
uniref:Nectin cell adhesion molecule 4 n=1 Tax=Latimeria chalumnae TaxID=7897 RepID=H3AT63_LATCH